ncbi:hypothetical protein BH20ACI2_BH20ACI2_02200 [soil metagenome]
MSVIAVEGCSHAGKTTLIKHIRPLVPGIITLPDYVAFAGGDDKVPPAPAQSVSEEMDALRFFFDLDYKRWKSAVLSLSEDYLILADRSFHTLLAHRLSIQHLTKMDIFEPSCALARSRQDLLRPDLILYLDTPQTILDQRYKTRISKTPVNGHIKNYDYEEKMKLVFNKHGYNETFREYFIPKIRFGDTPIAVLDGSLSINALVSAALSAMGDI